MTINGRTKPDSAKIEIFVDDILKDIKFATNETIYDGEGSEFRLDLSNPKELRRVLKDGIYGVLWGRYSAKTRESVKDLKDQRAAMVKELQDRGVPQERIDQILNHWTEK